MNLFSKLMLYYLLKAALLPLRLLPVKKKRIVFAGLTGANSYEYSCNPKYLCEYLLEHGGENYEILWAVSDPEKYRFLEARGIRLIRHFTLSSFYWLSTAGVVVTNGSYTPWFPFRRKQYVVNTWHGGGAYKNNENSGSHVSWLTRKRARIASDNTRLFISSCRAGSRYFIRGTFLYRGEIMPVGLPRNDLLVRGETAEAAAKVRRHFGLAFEARIVLFAPTYRPTAERIVLDADRVLAELGRDGGEWHFLLRAHRYQEGEGLSVTGDAVLAAGDYPDMQELLAAADVMITDYSSCIWDYSFLYRPCYLYTPDLEAYLASTGFYIDIHRWPFPICMDMDELCRSIREFDGEELRRRIDRHHRELGSLETGKARALICDRLKMVMESGR